MFDYHVPSRIVFGAGQVEKLTKHLVTISPAKKWLVVSDPGIVGAGLLAPIVQQLRISGFEAEVFSSISQNPRDEECIAGATLLQQTHCEAVLGIGGGSAMDTAKTIALLAAGGGSPQEYVDGLLPYVPPLPVVAVPTTAGTGSEVTRSAVITEVATHRKMTLKHAELRPRLAVLDPLLTLTVPESVTAATGVDALVHAIEGYTCTVSSPITKAFGARAMATIVPALPRAVEDPRDVEARTNMLEGSLLAGLCFGSADVAAVHCLAEALGSLYDTPHGVANAIFLPEVLRFNAQSNLGIHAEISRSMGFASNSDTESRAVLSLLDGIEQLTHELGIPRLKDLGYVQEVDFPRIVELSLANSSTLSNIRPISSEDYADILAKVFSA